MVWPISCASRPSAARVTAARRDRLRRRDVHSAAADVPLRAGGGRRVTTKGRPIPRYALSRLEAAESLGMSPDSFERYVQPEIKLIRRNTLRLVPVPELERWVAENAAFTLD